MASSTNFSYRHITLMEIKLTSLLADCDQIRSTNFLTLVMHRKLPDS